MLLPDVSVLVYALRPDVAGSNRFQEWLQGLVDGGSAYACSDHVLSGFVRVVTNPRVLAQPESLDDAVSFAEAFRSQPHCVAVSPGPAHWGLFTRLARDVSAKGNLVPDAYFAALAIESGCEWVTTGRDYARFPGLRWRHPFDT